MYGVSSGLDPYLSMQLQQQLDVTRAQNSSLLMDPRYSGYSQTQMNSALSSAGLTGTGQIGQYGTIGGIPFNYLGIPGLNAASGPVDLFAVGRQLSGPDGMVAQLENRYYQALWTQQQQQQPQALFAPQGYGYPTQGYGYPTQSYGYPTQGYGYPTQNYGYPTQGLGYPVQQPPTQTSTVDPSNPLSQFLNSDFLRPLMSNPMLYQMFGMMMTLFQHMQQQIQQLTDKLATQPSADNASNTSTSESDPAATEPAATVTTAPVESAPVTSETDPVATEPATTVTTAPVESAPVTSETEITAPTTPSTSEATQPNVTTSPEDTTPDTSVATAEPATAQTSPDIDELNQYLTQLGLNPNSYITFEDRLAKATSLGYSASTTQVAPAQITAESQPVASPTTAQAVESTAAETPDMATATQATRPTTDDLNIYLASKGLSPNAYSTYDDKLAKATALGYQA